MVTRILKIALYCINWISYSLICLQQKNLRTFSLPLFGLIQQITNWWMFYLFFSENGIWHLMEIVSNIDQKFICDKLRTFIIYDPFHMCIFNVIS